MTDEFSNKQREFEKLRQSFEDLMMQLNQTRNVVKSREAEISSLREIMSEKSAANDKKSEQYTQLERIVADLEEKNKRLTDLLNS